MPANYQIRIENGRLFRTRLPDTNQPTLPAFELPPKECEPNPAGKHHFVTIKSYSAIRYWPESAYRPFCSYCSKSQSA